VIQLIDVHKAFGPRQVLKGFSLEVAEGETMVIIGYSGTGKSVAIKHIVGLLEPDSGRVIVDDLEVPRLKRRDLYRLRARIGYVFQNAALFDSLSIGENVAMGLRKQGELSEPEIRDRVHEMLDLVDLDGSADRFPAELSGGMRKRVGIARAIALRPKYLLYDEPTTGLDPVTSAVIDELMIRMREKLGVTGIVITHELTLPVAVEQFRKGYGSDAMPHDADKLLFVADHTIQIPLIRDDWQSQIMVEKSARYVKELGIKNAFLPPAPFTSQGICHVLFPELGLIQPDTLVAGTDSHTSTHGAFGAFAVGIGNTDLTEIMASGRLLLDVPQTIRVNLSGRLQPGVYAKDVILSLLAQVGENGFTNCVVEFGGTLAGEISADDRSTIANMTVEGGATCGLFPVGQLRSDDAAQYKQHMTFDLSALTPFVAVPYSPANGRPIATVGDVPIDIAWVGSCTGGKLEDVAAAAAVVRGRRVARGVQLIVAPATLHVMHEAGRLGYLRDIIEAGGSIAQSACGACIAMGPGTTFEGQVAVYSSNRNFKGRSGRGQVYLASPATVAASAVAGRVADPREYLRTA